VPPEIETIPTGAARREARDGGIRLRGGGVRRGLGLAAKLAPRSLPKADWPTPRWRVLRNAESFNGEAAGRLEAFLEAGGQALVLIDKSSPPPRGGTG